MALDIFPEYAVRSGRPFPGGMRLVAVFLLVAAWLAPSLRAGEQSGNVPLEKLLSEFSDPARRTDSNRILDEILRRVGAMAVPGHFASGELFLRQLEPARIGRTFSLQRSPEKQDQDAQLFRIRKFIVQFYQLHAEYERNRGLSVEAESLKPSRYLEALERTKKWLGNRPESDLPCFEDDQASTPYSRVDSSGPLIMVPTAFFLGLPSMCCQGLPHLSPFSFLRGEGNFIDVALDPSWSWSFTNWQGKTQSLIIGMSPLGDQLIWVAGPLSGNRSLMIESTNGRWVIVAGETVADPPAGFRVRPPVNPNFPREKK